MTVWDLGKTGLVSCYACVPSVTILRDTAAKQSCILNHPLPFSSQFYCGSDTLVWRVKMSAVHAPLHFVQVTSKLASGKFKIAVRPRLPITGVDFILGNDLARGKVFPLPEVVNNPVSAASDCCPCVPCVRSYARPGSKNV